MFAVIEIAGKQFCVKKGDTLEIDKNQGEIESTFDLDKVLFLSQDETGKDSKIGTPYVEGASVKAKIVETGKSKKVVILKHKAKKRYKVKRGHRQPFSTLEILEINN